MHDVLAVMGLWRVRNTPVRIMTSTCLAYQSKPRGALLHTDLSTNCSITTPSTWP